MNSRNWKIGLSLFAFSLLCFAVMWTLRSLDDPIAAPPDAADTAHVVVADRSAALQPRPATLAPPPANSPPTPASPFQGPAMTQRSSVGTPSSDPNTRESAKVQLDVAPYTAKPFGVDDGLDMQSGDRITLQSTPYRDRVAQIP
jgi:hypothetical protein